MFKNHFKLIILLSIPLILKYVFLFVFSDIGLIFAEDVLEDFFFFLVIVCLFCTKIKTWLYYNFISFAYIFYLILETTSYLSVSSNFSSSYMYLLIESNTSELNEFIDSYLNLPVAFYILINIILFFLINKIRFGIKIKLVVLYNILFLGSIVFFLKYTGLIESNAYHNIVRGTYGYFNLQNSIKFNSDINTNDILVNSANDILVVVLGESTTTGHMQLYGYNKETTPLLNSVSDSLYIYNNVISTDVFTLKSVPKILSSLDVNSKTDNLINLVEIFNVAGYETYWLSNQRPISYHDNAISKMASTSKNFKFYNHVIDKNTTTFDDVMFTDYNKILKASKKSVIFVRLIGTHFDYNKRYPKSYNKFSSIDSKKSKKSTVINQYDNAVLYNDYIVYSLIEDLKKRNKKSALLYLSDHGENVYDDGTDFFGRSEEILTKSMFEIPFLLWTSKDFEYPIDFEYVPDRAFMADHTFESIGHIFGVSHSSMKANKSIFSQSFKARKRIVLEGIDFDNHFIDK